MNINDEKILSALLSNDSGKRDRALYIFYNNKKLQRGVKNHVMSRGGSAEDAKDVFQEVMYIFDRNIRQGKFNKTCTLDTYFYSIVGWHWLTFARKHRKYDEKGMMPSTEYAKESDVKIMEEEKKNVLDSVINQLDKKCIKLLNYYKTGHSMKEIKDHLDLSSPQMAKKQAYRCRKRLKKLLEKNLDVLKYFNIKPKND